MFFVVFELINYFNSSTSELLKVNPNCPELEQLVIQHYMNADGWNATTDDRTEYFEVEEVLRVRFHDNFLQALVLWDGHLSPTWEPLPFVYHTDAYKNYQKKTRLVRILKCYIFLFYLIIVFLADRRGAPTNPSC